MAKLRPVSIIIAIASVAILVFVPLFSDSSDPHLYDVLEVFFDKPSTIESYSIMLPIAMLFCTLILLVTSIIGKKSALIGGAIACIVIFCGVIFAQFFITKYNQFSGFGDYMSLVFESFGFNIWAQIVIYVISLILGIVSPKKANAQFRYAQPGPYQQYNNGQPYGQQQPP
ncbi:MAG: hypothetical protein IJS94_02535, partial [Clostridia bacterium]|nr:hypothetical protein [Clostridia bacterium]